MKKLLCILLALSFILAGCKEKEEEYICNPLGWISVEDISTLENMRETIADEDMDDRDFRKYATEQYPNVTIGGFQPLFQEDFAELLRLYDNMQVPAPPNAKLTFMEFSPSRHYNRFTLSYTIEETGEHYGFTFSPYKSNQSVWETIKKNTKSKPKCLYTNGSNISVYDNGRNTTETALWFCLDADGKYVSASYTSTGLKDGSIKIKDIAVEDIFKDICLTPLCDIPWDNTEKTAQP